ncbi:MAG TPA: hypothetical protein VGU67_01950 [Edaphobacter sp.]|nr:hypothetical protein [Edaphobacter sp.]
MKIRLANAAYVVQDRGSYGIGLSPVATIDIAVLYEVKEESQS